MIENIKRPVYKFNVSTEVAMREHRFEDTLNIMHINVIAINHDDDLGPRHLPSAPDGVHHPSRLQRILLIDLDHGAIVEAAKQRQVVVFNIVNQRFEQREKNALGCFAEVVIFLRRKTDNRGGIARVAAMCDRGYIHDWISIRQRIEPGVITKRPFEHRAGAEFGIAARRIKIDLAALGRDESLDHDLGIGGHIKRNRLASNQRYRAAVEKSRHE